MCVCVCVCVCVYLCVGVHVLHARLRLRKCVLVGCVRMSVDTRLHARECASVRACVRCMGPCYLAKALRCSHQQNDPAVRLHLDAARFEEVRLRSSPETERTSREHRVLYGISGQYAVLPG